MAQKKLTSSITTVGNITCICFTFPKHKLFFCSVAVVLPDYVTRYVESTDQIDFNQDGW